MKRLMIATLATAVFAFETAAQEKPKAPPAGPDRSGPDKPAAAGSKAGEPTAAVAAKPAAQAAGASAGSIATGWIVNCATPQASGKLLCEMQNSVIITPANQRFVSVALRRDPATSSEVMVASLPHGVLFTSGVVAQVDGKEIGKFEPLTSDQTGAYVKLPMKSEIASILEKGENLTVIFDGAGGQKFTVALSLNGFGSAFAKMKSEK